MLCGENGALKALQDTKDAIQAKIKEGMSALSELESKATDALASLEEFKITLPELPDLQSELAKLQAEATNGLAFATKLAEIKQQFGDAVDNLDDVIKDLGLDDFPPSFTLADIQAKLCDVPNKQVNQSGVVQEKPAEPKEATAYPVDMPVFPTPVPPSVPKKVVVPTGTKDYSVTDAPVVDGKTLAEIMLQRESGGDYQIVNDLGYIGGYQFGAGALETIGYLRAGTWEKYGYTNAGLGIDANWKGTDGITSKAAFLAKPAIQDKAFQLNVNSNLSTLKLKGAVTSLTTEAEKNGLLAASHLIGATGVANAFKDGGLDGLKKVFDGNGVSGYQYYQLGIQAVTLSGTEVEFSGTWTAKALIDAMNKSELDFPAPLEGNIAWYYKGIYYSIWEDLAGSPTNKTRVRGWPLPDLDFGLQDIPKDTEYNSNAEMWTAGKDMGLALLENYEVFKSMYESEHGVVVGDFAGAVTLYNGGR